MIILVSSLAGCFIGWLAARHYGMDEIEMLTNIGFAVGGSWLGTGIGLKLFNVPFGTTASPLCIFAGCVGALAGVALYKYGFHPHSNHHNWPRLFH